MGRRHHRAGSELRRRFTLRSHRASPKYTLSRTHTQTMTIRSAGACSWTWLVLRSPVRASSLPSTPTSSLHRNRGITTKCVTFYWRRRARWDACAGSTCCRTSPVRGSLRYGPISCSSTTGRRIAAAPCMGLVFLVQDSRACGISILQRCFTFSTSTGSACARNKGGIKPKSASNIRVRDRSKFIGNTITWTRFPRANDTSCARSGSRVFKAMPASTSSRLAYTTHTPRMLGSSISLPTTAQSAFGESSFGTASGNNAARRSGGPCLRRSSPIRTLAWTGGCSGGWLAPKRGAIDPGYVGSSEACASPAGERPVGALASRCAGSATTTEHRSASGRSPRGRATAECPR